MRLCDADSASLLLADEAHTQLSLAASLNARTEAPLGETHPITSGHTSSDAVLTGKFAQVHDARDTELYRRGDPVRVELVDEWGMRTSLAVPLLKGDRAIGAIEMQLKSSLSGSPKPEGEGAVAPASGAPQSNHQ